MNRLRKIMTFITTLFMCMGMMNVNAYAANADKDSGKGGEGTLTITEAHKDQTYELFRVFEAVVNANDNAKVSYKPLAGKTIPTNDYFKVENGYIIVQDAAKDTKDPNALSAGAIAWLNTNHETIGEKVTEVVPTEDESDQKVTGLPFGYYFVTTTTGTGISVDTTNKDAVVLDKNPGTSIDKSITGVTDGSVDDTTKEKALAQVGTTVDYEVRIPIAQNAKSYLFTDVMTDGLTYIVGSIEVYVVEHDAVVPSGATALVAGTDAANKYGTLTEAANATGTDADIKIVFNDAMLAANNGKDIVLKYQATVNANAVIANASNPNTATIHWGHETDALKDSDDAEVYSAKLTVKKVDGTDVALEGAGFKLKNSAGKWYKNTAGIVSWVDAEADGTEIKPVKGTQPNPAYDSAAAAAAAAAGEEYGIPETIPGDDAVASFTGIADGTYTLVETTVPNGYNKASDTEVTIKPASKNNLTTEIALTSTVTNNQGTELPSTGGIGTTIFYIVGGIMVAGAVVFLLTKRRMAGNEQKLRTRNKPQ